MRMTRIDAHQHFWRISRGDYSWLSRDSFPQLYRDYEPEHLSPLLNSCGVDRTILVQAAESAAETDYLLGLASDTPFVAGVVGWVDFEAADASEQIARLAMHAKLVGLRPMLQNLPDDQWILRSSIRRAVDALILSGLRLDILIFPRHLPHILEFLGRHSELKAVIDHGAKPGIGRGEFEPWASWMRRLARETNVYCKLSGLLTEAGPLTNDAALKPYVDVLLESFGPRRLMWGSDWPVLTLAGDYAGWIDQAHRLTAGLSSADRASVFGGTATQFYGLET